MFRTFICKILKVVPKDLISSLVNSGLDGCETIIEAKNGLIVLDRLIPIFYFINFDFVIELYDCNITTSMIICL